MTNEILNLFKKIVLLVMFGVVFKKKRIITNDMKSQISSFLMKAVLPISILSSANQEFSPKFMNGLVKVTVISFIYYILSILLVTILSRKLEMSENSKKIFILMSVFANVGFVGFPIMDQLFHSSGTLYTVAYNMCYQIFFFSYGIYLLSSSEKFEFKVIFENPITIISICSIVMYLSSFRFPSIVESTMTSIGGMIVPLSMIIIGCEIADMDINVLLKDKYSYLVSLIRLIILPAIMCIILKLLGVEKEVACVCVILTALPVGTLNVIMAQEYNCDAGFAARTAAQSMVWMIFSLPMAIFMAEYLFK